MSTRQQSLTFKVLDDMTLRAFNKARVKKDTISEWHCNYIGNPCGTLTTNIPKMVVYEW